MRRAQGQLIVPTRVCWGLMLGLLLSSASAAAADGQWHSTAIGGGTISDGLDISGIRYGRHPGFERLVMDVSNWQGMGTALAGRPAVEPGHFEVVPDYANHRLLVSLGGFRAFTASIPTMPPGSRIHGLMRLKGEQYEDDSTIALAIQLACDNRFRAFVLTRPSRIVLDLGDCT